MGRRTRLLRIIIWLIVISLVLSTIGFAIGLLFA